MLGLHGSAAGPLVPPRRRAASRIRAVGARLAALLCAALVCLLPTGPAAAAPTPGVPAPGAPAAGRSWSVEATGNDTWRVSWRSETAVPVRDDVAYLVADGRRLGIARLERDGRTLTTTTSDPRVLRARSVELRWSTEPSPDAARRSTSSAAGDPAWETPTGPVLTDDPAAPGRYGVTQRDYDLGDTAVRLPAVDARVELRGRVYLPKGATGRRPVVLFLHGMHAPCYGGGDDSEFGWPCPGRQKPVPSHLGYAAMARTLASRGYVVASLSANGINVQGNDDLDAGQRGRGQLVLATLDLMARGERGTGALAFLRHRVDLDRVGLMGHSRGGEGVVRAALQNTQRPHPYGIRSLFLIAPTDFARLAVPGVSTAVLLPYCDGDVFDLQGQHVLDDTRLGSPKDRSIRSSILMLGANHNYFNTEWSPGSVSQGYDDAWSDDERATCGPKNPGRLSPAQQQRAGNAYLAGWVRATLGHERRVLPLFDGSGARAASAGKAVVRTAFTAASSDRVDVAALNRGVPTGAASRGARLVACAGIVARTGGPDEPVGLPSTAGGRPACSTRLGEGQASHWSPSPLAAGAPGTGVGRLTWSSTSGRVRLPLARGHRDVRRTEALRLLMSPDPSVAGPQDLTVRVVDGRGRSARVRVSSVSDALRPLPGGREDLPRVQLRTVLVPLTRLKGVDRRDIRRVELLTNRSARGAVFVGDVSFTRTRVGRSGPARLPELRVTGSPTVREGAAGTSTTVAFTVRLSRPSRSDVTFEWSAGIDLFRSFVLPGQSEVVPRRTGRVRIPAGTTSKTVTVRVRGNDRDGDDTFLAGAASAPSGAVLGVNVRGGLVRDDDPTPSVTVAAATASEGDGVLRFPVTLSAPSDSEVFVSGKVVAGTAKQGSDWTIEGDEGPYVYGFVPVGNRTIDLEVPLVDDRVAEPTETLRLELQDLEVPISGSGTATGTILDDD